MKTAANPGRCNPLFAALVPDAPGSLDGVLGTDNMRLLQEQRTVRLGAGMQPGL
jgi:hypothetical protein